MPGMTMPFKVKDAALLSGKEPGDLVTATLVVGEVDAHLSTLTRTGHAPLDAPPAVARRAAHPAAWRDRWPTRCSSTRTASRGRSRAARPPRGADVHLHALPAARVLSADGPALRRRAEDDRRRRRRWPTCGCVTVTLDPEFDTPAVLSRTPSGSSADPARLDVRDRRADGRRATSRQQFGIYTSSTNSRTARRHHPQPAHRRHRRRRPAGDSAHRQRLDAGRTRCRPQSDSRSRALIRPSRRALPFTAAERRADRAAAHAGRRAGTG